MINNQKDFSFQKKTLIILLTIGKIIQIKSIIISNFTSLSINKSIKTIKTNRSRKNLENNSTKPMNNIQINLEKLETKYFLFFFIVYVIWS